MSNGARIEGFVVGTVSLTVTDLGAGLSLVCLGGLLAALTIPIWASTESHRRALALTALAWVTGIATTFFGAAILVGSWRYYTTRTHSGASRVGGL